MNWYRTRDHCIMTATPYPLLHVANYQPVLSESSLYQFRTQVTDATNYVVFTRHGCPLCRQVSAILFRSPSSSVCLENRTQYVLSLTSFGEK